jgi:hypothetical protein
MGWLWSYSSCYVMLSIYLYGCFGCPLGYFVMCHVLYPVLQNAVWWWHNLAVMYPVLQYAVWWWHILAVMCPVMFWLRAVISRFGTMHVSPSCFRFIYK